MVLLFNNQGGDVLAVRGEKILYFQVLQGWCIEIGFDYAQPRMLKCGSSDEVQDAVLRLEQAMRDSEKP